MHERAVEPFRYVCFQKDDRYRRAARAILLAATAGAISPGPTSAHVYGRRTETGMGERGRMVSASLLAFCRPFSFPVDQAWWQQWPAILQTHGLNASIREDLSHLQEPTGQSHMDRRHLTTFRVRYISRAWPARNSGIAPSHRTCIKPKRPAFPRRLEHHGAIVRPPRPSSP